MQITNKIKKAILPLAFVFALNPKPPVLSASNQDLPSERGKILSAIKASTTKLRQQERKKYELTEIKGVYLHAWKARNKGGLEELVKNMKKSSLNTVVVDIKSNAGEVLYKTSNPLAKEVGSRYNALGKLENFVKNLHDQDIYVIARHVIYNDPILAKKRSDLAIQDSNGRVWKGEMKNRFVPWVDPYSQEVQEYNLYIMEEACRAGIDEIQFDYIRFPAHKNLVYPHQNQEASILDSKIKVLQNFLKQAQAIAGIHNVKVGLDIFGFSIFNKGDLGIGHSFTDLLPYLDVISPMLYPSHYTPGNFGFKRPQDYPYEVVFRSMKLAKEMAKEHGVVVRPWIQAFAWNTPTYSDKYIIEEIRGVCEGGSTSYLVWNANNDYNKLFSAIEKAGPDALPCSSKNQELPR